MDKETEYRLIAMAQQLVSPTDSEQAKLALLTQHDRALWSIAKHTKSRSESKTDLHAWAVLFFLQCIIDFKFEYDVRLTTFYYQHVANRVHGVAWRCGPVHLPTNAKATDPVATDRAFKLSAITDKNIRLVEREMGFESPAYFEAREEREILRCALTKLPERWRRVLEMRIAGEPLRRIADHFSISRERVRQVEVKAIERIRWLLHNRLLNRR